MSTTMKQMSVSSVDTDKFSPETQVTSDEAHLARLGYKQEFQRAFNPLEVFGIGFSVIGLFPSIASVLVYAIPNGGPISMVWGWAACSFFLMFIAFAMAEMASAAPTSGGLYYWTYTFASPRYRAVLSWVVGYSNSIGLISGFAAIEWGCAVQLLAAVSIGTDTSFSPTTGQTYGVFAALVLCHCCMASLATPIIARLQGIYAGLNVLLCIAIIIALPAATPKGTMNSASYALGGFENLTNWPNGFAFVLSFLAPLWTIGGFDAAVHISEEVSNARVAVPWAIISATGVAGVLGWAINVTLVFCMGTDLQGILASPIGQPMATILFNSLGKSGSLAVWSIVVVTQFLMGSSALTACSRQTFAFARDGALPFSRQLYRINPYTLTPINCVLFSALVACALDLLAFAGPDAISAIFSLGPVGQYLAFSIPFACRFLGGRPWVAGPFTLGKLGLPVAVIAVIWMIFSMIILSFPATANPEAGEMNYTSAVFGGWIFLCLVYYYLPVYGGVNWFTGPVSNISETGEPHGEKD